MFAAIETILATGAVIAFVAAVLAFAAYALVRPFTHVHHERRRGKLWRPLD